LNDYEEDANETASEDQCEDDEDNLKSKKL